MVAFHEGVRRRIVCILVVIFAFPCGVMAGPSSPSGDIRATFATASRLFATPGAIRADNCARTIGALVNPLANVPASELLAGARIFGDDAARRFFDLRRSMKSRLDSLSRPGEACVDAFRRALRYARFAEDYILEHSAARDPGSERPLGLFAGGYPFTTAANGADSRIDFRAGDVFMMGSPASESAMIARAGREEGDFSHLMIVGEDAGGALFGIEARPEHGITITPLRDYLEHIEARAVLMRARDPVLARKAGREAHLFATRAMAEGRATPFDLSFDIDDHKRIFCAELAHIAYENASGGAVVLPTYRSRLRNLAPNPFMAELGIRVTSSFMPADMELDPRFEIVAEFRNPPMLAEMRVRTAAIASLYRWLKAGDRFRAETLSDTFGSTLVSAAYGPTAIEGVPSERLALFVKVRLALNIIEENARARDGVARSSRGAALTFPELIATNDRFRRLDCAGRFGGDRTAASETSLRRVFDSARPECRR